MKEKQMRNLKTQKGITLIALVVTIIVLIILASISIATLTGDNGIIQQSKEAKEQTEIAEEKEIVNLAAIRAMGKDRYGNVTEEYLREELDELIGNGKYDLSGNGPFTITFLESKRSYKVDTDGSVISSGEVGESGEDGYVPTNPDYFTYTLDEETKTATLTGIKDEYMLKSYYYDPTSSKYYAAAIIDGENKITDIKIPNKIIQNGTTYTVTAIGNFAFGSPYFIRLEGKPGYDKESEFTSFYIPDTIINIEERAFYSCVNLTEIVIPSSVNYIGLNVFGECINLKRISIYNEKGYISGEPWGAENDTQIEYFGNIQFQEFATNYLADKNQEELEELILKTARFTGTIEEFKQNVNLEQSATEKGMEYNEYLIYILKHEESWVYVEYMVSKQVGEGKTVQELENLFVEKIGYSGTFEQLLAEENMTRVDFEKMIKEQGFRSEEDFLKVSILMH